MVGNGRDSSSLMSITKATSWASISNLRIVLGFSQYLIALHGLYQPTALGFNHQSTALGCNWQLIALLCCQLLIALGNYHLLPALAFQAQMSSVSIIRMATMATMQCATATFPLMTLELAMQ